MNGLKKTFTIVVAASLVCLSSAGAMAASKLIVKDSTGVTDKFVVTDTGYIGINTSTPTTALNMVGTSLSSTQLRVLLTSSTASDSGAFMFLRNNASGTNSLPLTGNKLGAFSFGAMESGTTLRVGASINTYAYANWSSTSTPTYIAFITTTSGTATPAERMRVNHNGYVGIGAAGPTQRLEVNGGIRLNTADAQPACSGSTRGVIWVFKAGVGAADTFQVCSKDASENYAWRNLF